MHTESSGLSLLLYDDHRIAMTYALTACPGVPVNILDPGCTAKTFPTYFEEFARISGK